MSDSLDYYRRRHAEEVRRAEDAANAEVADIHRELARSYQALIDQPDLRGHIHIAYIRNERSVDAAGY